MLKYLNVFSQHQKYHSGAPHHVTYQRPPHPPPQYHNQQQQHQHNQYHHNNQQHYNPIHRSGEILFFTI